jgi:hypothetical protein
VSYPLYTYMCVERRRKKETHALAYLAGSGWIMEEKGVDIQHVRQWSTEI